MSKNKYTDILCILITVFAILITLLFINGEAFGLTAVTSDDIADKNSIFSERDYKETWDETTAIKISLNKLEHFRSGGAYELNGDLYIVNKGTYILSGDLKNHQIIVSAENAKIQLVLAGITIEESDRAAIFIQEADKVFLTLSPDSQNSITVDSLSSENDDDSVSNDKAIADTITTIADNETIPDAAIYSNDDLTINGSGSLSISIQDGHGIKSKDDLVIVNGNLSITSGNTALLGKDSVRIGGGNFDLKTGSDGIKANNDTDAEKGYVKIVNGNLLIDAERDGIQAQTNIEIEGGEITISAGEEYEDSEFPIGEFDHNNFGEHQKPDHPMSSDSERMPGGSMTPDGSMAPDRGMPPDGSMAPGSGMTSDGSMAPDRGMTLDGSMAPSGGMIPDSGMAPDGNMLPDGNAMPDGTGNNSTPHSKGLKAGSLIQISDGTLLIETCYEGLEANDIEITGGTIDITSFDDGLNASNSTSGSTLPLLHISGGSLHVNARGDGLDSNGDLIIDGGNIIVDGPSDSGNGALDSGTEIGGDLAIHGGTVLALGASGMAETFSENSTQYSFLCTFESSYTQGDTIIITDSSGTDICSYEAQKSGNSIVFSSPDLKMGETYTIQAGSLEQELSIESITNGKSIGWGMGNHPSFPDGF